MEAERISITVAEDPVSAHSGVPCFCSFDFEVLLRNFIEQPSQFTASHTVCFKTEELLFRRQKTKRFREVFFSLVQLKASSALS